MEIEEGLGDWQAMIGLKFQSKTKGFSVMELLLVIAVLGILAAMAMPRLTAVDAQRDLDNAARQLVVDLRWTSQVAANSVDTVTVVFVNAAPYGYRVEQGAAGIVIKPTQSFPATVSFSAVVSPVSFDVYGKPTGAANVAIPLQNTAGQTRTVNIDYLTGRVW